MISGAAFTFDPRENGSFEIQYDFNDITSCLKKNTTLERDIQK